MVTSTIRVWFGAQITLDLLPEGVRQQLLGTVERLQQTPPAEWPREQVLRTPDAEERYLLRIPPDYQAILRRTDEGELEIRHIFREEAVRIWREMERRNGSTHG